MPLSWKSYVCDPRPDYPLLITAKRYWKPESLSSDDPAAFTLIFAHGTGFHKEQWEPTIEDLYERVDREGKPGIKEVWCIDSPNAGDAAILNEKTLLHGYSVFDWQEYARAIHIFLAGLGTGVDVDFRKHKLVGIGHSMGAIAVMLAATFTPKVTFNSIMLVDPMLLPPGPSDAGSKTNTLLVGAGAGRRDVWPSREEAYTLCKARAAYQAWDPRVLRIFIEHGLRDLPTAYYPDKTEGVTLKYSKMQEVASYKAELGRLRAYDYLPVLCERVPVHFIHGANDDTLPRSVQDYVLKIATKGNYASAHRVAGAGHLVPQMQPRGLANAIWEALTEEPRKPSPSQSRL